MILLRLERKIRKVTGLPEIPKYKMHRFLKTHHVIDLQNKLDTQDKSVTIIIPCYKHSAYLKKCFESISKQTIKPSEIIFVNDNSPDNTADVISNIVNIYSTNFNIKIINNISNLGQSESINLACSQTSSKYIMILNDDDYLYPDALEISIKIFTERPELALIGSTTTAFTREDDITDDIQKLKILPRKILPTDIFIHNPQSVLSYKNNNDINMTHSSSMFLRGAWKSVGGYISKKKDRIINFSDRDFQIRVALLYPIGVILTIPLSFWRSDSSVDAGVNS